MPGSLDKRERHVKPHRLVIKQGLQLMLVGLAARLAGVLALTRLVSTVMSDLLFGVRATDRLTFVGIMTLLVCAALVACYLARRATKLDPMIALRTE